MTENTLLESAKKALKRLGLRVRRKRGRPPRATVQGEQVWVLETHGEEHEVLATPLDGPMPPTEHGGPRPRLWVCRFVGPAQAERFKQTGDGFVDEAGNVHLDLPGMRIEARATHTPPQSPRDDEPKPWRAWRSAAIRLLFHGLCKPELMQSTAANIAKIAAVAPATVFNLFKDLEQTGHLVRLEGHDRRFLPDEPLVNAWLAEHNRKVRMRLRLARFRAPDQEWWREFDPRRYGALWGGQPAAQALGADLNASRVTIYAQQVPTALLRAARLRPDSQGNVEVRRTFWHDSLNHPEATTTPPLLVIADLTATRDGRCIEAAEHLRREYPVGSVQ